MVIFLYYLILLSMVANSRSLGSAIVVNDGKIDKRGSLDSVTAGVNLLANGFISSDNWILDTTTPFSPGTISVQSAKMAGFDLGAVDDVISMQPMNDSDALNSLTLINTELIPPLAKFINDSMVQIPVFEVLGLCDSIYNLVQYQQGQLDSFLGWVKAASPEDLWNTFDSVSNDVDGIFGQWGITFQKSCVDAPSVSFETVNSAVNQILGTLQNLSAYMSFQIVIPYEAVSDLSLTLISEIENATEAVNSFSTPLSDFESRGCIGDLTSLEPGITTLVTSTTPSQAFIQSVGECKNISSVFHDIRNSVVDYIDAISNQSSPAMQMAVQSVVPEIDAAFQPAFIAFAPENCTEVPVSAVFETMESAILGVVQYFGLLWLDYNELKNLNIANPTQGLVLEALQNATDIISPLPTLDATDAQATIAFITTDLQPIIKALLAQIQYAIVYFMRQNLCGSSLEFFTAVVPSFGNLTTLITSKMPSDYVNIMASLSNTMVTEMNGVMMAFEPENCEDVS
ncbi:hypothetical protein BX600DRAFT_443734 [Xylariales sp. PMI_506]|nr:hypothetical protein BX600DRAFT_443734 [Xylariales sp. PMI_506]